MGKGFCTAVLAGLACLVGPAQLQASATGHEAPLTKSGNWERIFTEEFDGTRLDESKWTTCYWWNKGGCTNLANNELQWYLPDNVSMADGQLRLRAVPETVRGKEGRTFNYSSGMVTTGRDFVDRAGPDRFAARQGFFEIRAKLPKGKGLWPAIWLLPSTQEAKPEIDIMEVLGHATDVLEMHVHFLDQHEAIRSEGASVKTVDLSADWHVYGLEWRKDAIVWYLDGKEVWRFQDPAGIPDEPMYLLINLAVGGEWPGAPDAQTAFPADFLIDYVRVWRALPS